MKSKEITASEYAALLKRYEEARAALASATPDWTLRTFATLEQGALSYLGTLLLKETKV